MASSNKNNRNLDVILKIIGIERKRYPIFEGDTLLIYSPAIQSNSSDGTEGVDISNDNMSKIVAADKTSLIIIRYYNDFLIFNAKQIKEEHKKISRTNNRWSFKVKNNGSRTLDFYLSNSTFSTSLKIYSKAEFISLMEEEYQVQFNKFEDVAEGNNLIPHIQKYIKSKGFNYSPNNIKNLYLSLRSKPFVIISGISGTGKTKIVQLFAESVGATEGNGQFLLVPVRPDWSDSSELLGYTDIKGKFIEGPLTKLLIHAKNHPEAPHFLLLDEMNLARVEYYFSDVLSVMESRGLENGQFTSSKLSETPEEGLLYFPGNLYIIGTVNMDETTHPFSKKVLDRANTLEFNEINLEDFTFLQEEQEVLQPVQLANDSLQANYIQIKPVYEKHKELVERVSAQLSKINGILAPIHAQVGFRVRDEICFYLAHNEEGGNLLTEEEALDFCYMQKILPRIAGSGERVETVLNSLEQLWSAEKYPLSDAKIKAMQERLRVDEFTSFWIS